MTLISDLWFTVAAERLNFTYNHKCTFSATSVSLMDYAISIGKIKPDPESIWIHCILLSVWFYNIPIRMPITLRRLLLLQVKAFPLLKMDKKTFECLKVNVENTLVHSVETIPL